MTPRLFPALAVLALGLPSAVNGASVRFETVTFTYTQHSRVPVPAGAPFSVEGAEALGLDPAEIVIGGRERTEHEQAIKVQLAGATPTRGEPVLDSFKSTIFYSVNNKASPPAYEATVYWAALPFQMPATLTVTTGAGQGQTREVGKRFTADVGPKPAKTSSGVFQMAAGPWTLMASEPCSAPEAAVARVKWIAEQMCADVHTVAGYPELSTSKGRARLRAKLDSFAEAEVTARLRKAVLEQINAILDHDLATGPRTAQVPLALVKGDRRFEDAQKTLNGSASDRFTAAVATLTGVLDDSRAKPRIRAAACYNMAVCRLGGGDLDAAAREIVRSREFNAQQGDGMFDSSGKELGKRIDGLTAVVKDRQERTTAAAAIAAAPTASADSAASPAVESAPVEPPSPAPSVPVAAAGTTARPWAEMTDDEFMAAFPTLAQAAAGRADQVEMQRLTARMTQIVTRSKGPKP